MTSLDVTAVGSGYYKVYINDVFFSQHTAEREALERCSEILNTDPTVTLYYKHDYKVIVTVEDVTAVIPDTTNPVTSDAGEDLIDFLARIQNIQEPGPDAEVLTGATFQAQLQDAINISMTKWLITNIYADMDGSGQQKWIGMVWRGYLMLWYGRDPNAIRVNVGG